MNISILFYTLELNNNFDKLSVEKNSPAKEKNLIEYKSNNEFKNLFD